MFLIARVKETFSIARQLKEPSPILEGTFPIKSILQYIEPAQFSRDYRVAYGNDQVAMISFWLLQIQLRKITSWEILNHHFSSSKHTLHA
jgi:hypothetical protein